MGEDCAMSEVVKKEGGEEQRGGEYEVSLELSIGPGRYGKSQTPWRNSEEPNNNYNYYFGIPRSDFSLNGHVDLQRRREFQAFRRQEARKKRDEKLKRSTKFRLSFEAPKLGPRTKGRPVKEKGAPSEEKNKGKENNEVEDEELSLSLFSDNRNVIPGQQMGVGDRLLYPEVQLLNYDLTGRETVVSNRSLEQISDYKSSSNKGGSISDTGSHSGPSRLHDEQYCSITNPKLDLHLSIESNGSSGQPKPDPHLIAASSSKPQSGQGPFPDGPKLDNHVSPAHSTTTTTCGGGLSKRAGRQMPCVSTMGNGPNGRTVTGLLYKYTRNEVSIVCGCHGRSFSPAGFVEHAGWVDVLHPMKHITVRPDLGI